MFPNPLNLNLYPALRELVVRYKPKSYLEIGVQEGSSLGLVLKTDTQRLINRIALCDIWGTEYGGTGRGNHKHIEKSLQEIGYQGEVSFHDGDSRQTVPAIHGTFDLVLVDGDHSPDGVHADMRNAWEKVAPGGVMVIDDLIHPAHKYTQGIVDNFVQNNLPDIGIILYDVKNLNGVAALQKINISTFKGDKNGKLENAGTIQERTGENQDRTMRSGRKAKGDRNS